MNREIKFRAWDKKQEKMWNDILAEIGENDYYNEEISMWEITFMMKNGDYSLFNFMQYTELKDKNGVDIYEGDVLKFENSSNKEVIFENGCFGIKELFRKSFYNENKELRFNPLFNLYKDDFFVTGNKFENPELLK